MRYGLSGGQESWVGFSDSGVYSRQAAEGSEGAGSRQAGDRYDENNRLCEQLCEEEWQIPNADLRNADVRHLPQDFPHLHVRIRGNRGKPRAEDSQRNRRVPH